MNWRLRVMAVCGSGVVGGAELWLRDLLAATDRLAVDAVILADGPLVAALTPVCATVTVRPTGRRPDEMLGAVAALTGRLRRERPDIVLANGIKAAAVAVPAARAAGVRSVWVKHDHSFDGRLLSTLVRRWADGVVATSPSLAAASGARGVVVIAPPRPATPPLPRAEARRRLAAGGVPDDDRLLLLAAGRIVRYKGLDDAIVALARPGGERWRLVAVGDSDPSEPDERDRLVRVARAVGVADRVVFTGPIAGAAALFRAADAVAVLTKAVGRGPDREGYGMVATEAMLAGVPVIATRGGPVVARLGRAGMPVPPAAPDAVATALGRLVDPAIRSAMGAAGLELVAEHPDATVGADRLARVLGLVACRPGAGRDDGPPMSVVTTVLNDADATDRLLERLVPQLAQVEDEIIVVDGGSRDDTAARVTNWASRDARVRLLVRPAAGISAGRNAAVAAARNEVVACTDAGCDPDAGWLAALRAAVADHGADTLFTGVYRVAADGPLQTAMAAVGYPEPEELRHPGALSRSYSRLLGRSFDPTMPTGRSMAFGVGVWHKAGGFPEDLQTGEDVLFGRSITAAGTLAVMVADAAVTWTQRPSAGQTARMYFHYGQGSGHSRDRRLLGRDLARLVAYIGGPVALTAGPRARRAAVVAAAAYLSLPLWRVLAARPAAPGAGRERRAVQVAAAAALVPPAAALRDLAKVAGALHGLLRRHR